MSDAPDQTWWTAAEIAAAALPDMPTTKRNVNAMADRFAWRAQRGFARRRTGRGGGWEYHWSLFPQRAQQALLAARTPVAEPAPAHADRDAAWVAFEALPEAVRDKARARLEIIQAVEMLETGGASRDHAVHEIARLRGVGHRTIWTWFALVEGVRADDRLAYLAPRHRMARRKTRRAEADPRFMDLLKSDFLRLEAPSFSTAYRRAVRIARAEGIEALTEQTARRRLNAEVSRSAQIYMRKGVDALKRLYPPQRRDKRSLHPMEAVNADYHKFDVFVRWPRFEGDPEPEILRPQMCAMQDIYSGRIVSWRLSRNPNKTDVSLCIGDMIERFGIPDHMLLDNGREFANKFLTGQAQTRHRFKIKDDDIQGVLRALDVDIHWATPYAGQSKPIERAFRDMCDGIAKDPRFAGAYTGNRPDAKPENYGSRAIDIEAFMGVLAEGIEEHNARDGRRTDTARGRSFIETFDAAYPQAPIRKATAEQRRLWLMGAEGVRADRSTGQIAFMDNRYWSDWMHGIAGERVIARFDPADLWSGLHVYALDGAYLGLAACHERGGFFDLDEARLHNSARKRWMSAEKAAAKAHKRLRTVELGAALDASAPAPAEIPEAKLIKPEFAKRPAPAPQPELPTQRRAAPAPVTQIAAARGKTPVQKDEARERYLQAKELERRIADGEAVKPTQQRWLDAYQRQAEYAAFEQMVDHYGAEWLG
ncbi:transposase domain-containing protein [Meridianimarinicoccus sp. RP-17]|uniref:transposase domain-containing protein n=1 Tax=Meridianimarinicoccus zhengii TaxID=2056810 RepID=UPI000DAB4338|nr:transposase domain-containing protein [Phycocomes zhengii]